jgi:hypothetical protein
LRTGREDIRAACAQPPQSSPAPIIRHVQVIVSLVEGRRVRLEEILDMLAKKGRQRRMVEARPGGYGAQRIEDRGS